MQSLMSPNSRLFSTTMWLRSAWQILPVRELMWKKPRLECLENRCINVDRKREWERGHIRTDANHISQINQNQVSKMSEQDNRLFYENRLINVVVGIGLNRFCQSLIFRFNLLIWFASDKHLIWKLIGSLPK